MVLLTHQSDSDISDLDRQDRDHHKMSDSISDSGSDFSGHVSGIV